MSILKYVVFQIAFVRCLDSSIKVFKIILITWLLLLGLRYFSIGNFSLIFNYSTFWQRNKNRIALLESYYSVFLLPRFYLHYMQFLRWNISVGLFWKKTGTSFESNMNKIRNHSISMTSYDYKKLNNRRTYHVVVER